MFIDLDHFKQVNDRLGHEAGDALLQAAAARMRACLREGDELYRIGGDEFTAILATVATPDEASAVAGRLVEAMGQPFSVRGQRAEVGASAGLALIPRDGDEVDQLLRFADAAMYQAKSVGRGTHVFHHPPPVPVAARAIAETAAQAADATAPA